MAGALLSPSTPTHTLRALPLALFPLSFVYLLIHGIAYSRVNPAMGIVPLFLSAGFSALVFAQEKRCSCQASTLTGTPLHLVADLVIGVASLVCLVLAWVSLAQAWRGVMMGTYGTAFLIGDSAIHFYLVARQVGDAARPGGGGFAACPECWYGPFAVPRGGRSGYAPLLDGEGEPREEARAAAEEAV